MGDVLAYKTLTDLLANSDTIFQKLLEVIIMHTFKFQILKKTLIESINFLYVFR